MPNNRVGGTGAIGTGALFDSFNNSPNASPFAGNNINNQEHWSLGMIPSQQHIYGSSMAQQ
jgi:hypothetical protein